MTAAAHTPLYARPMDLHAHSEGCDIKCDDGTTFCTSVYAAADYAALVSHVAELESMLDQINIAACYASEEDPGARGEALIHIGELARSALASKEQGK